MRDTRQPAMRRAQASLTNATPTTPAQVVTDVKSETWILFDAGRLQGRFTRSSGQCAALSVIAALTDVP